MDDKVLVEKTPQYRTLATEQSTGTVMRYIAFHAYAFIVGINYKNYGVS